MKRWLLIGASLGTLIIAGQHQIAQALPMANEGGDGGGYNVLPACGPAFFGVVLYVQHLFWLCINGTPVDFWVLL